MKILLAPAETKRPDGAEQSDRFDPTRLVFGPTPERMEAINAYEAFVQSADRATQAAFFGLKREEDIARYAGRTLLGKPAQKALIRYTGVAFEALDYETLEEKAKRWCDTNVLLFSNLFGPVLGGEALPDYRFKQGAQLPGLDSGAYERSFYGVLEAFLADECVLDLRAGWYIKRYPVARSIVPVFLKNGRILSHWAKTQRGTLTRFLATHRPENQSDLADLNPPGLALLEIRQHGAHEHWIFETAGP